jgi:hypothetical protein
VRSLAVVSGAVVADGPAPSPGRARSLIEQLARSGPVDVIVFHDRRASTDERRGRRRELVPAAGVERVLEVATAPPRSAGAFREIHLHRSDAEEVAARRTAAFRTADVFLSSAPTVPDLVWAADLTSLTRAGWLCRSIPAVVDIDRDEDLTTARRRRAARRIASAAHLVTVTDLDRREELALPGALVVVDGDGDRFRAAIGAAVEAAASYRPARTTP